MCFNFSNQINSDSKCLKKVKAFFVKPNPFLLNTLLIVFKPLTIQKIVKESCLLFKHTIKKARGFSKTTDVFIKNSVYVFLPQHKFKEQ